MKKILISTIFSFSLLCSNVYASSTIPNTLIPNSTKDIIKIETYYGEDSIESNSEENISTDLENIEFLNLENLSLDNFKWSNIPKSILFMLTDLKCLLLLTSILFTFIFTIPLSFSNKNNT